MLLAPIPFAERVWALPVMTALAPSERYHRERGQPHKRLTDFARQMLEQLARWLPGRALIVVADSSFAALELLGALAPRMTCITRLRLDAQLYAPAPPRRAGQSGRPRKKGTRLPALKSLLSDPATHWRALRIRHWYGGVARRLEITSATALWYHAGAPVLPLRWVLIRDPRRRFEPQALLSTDPGLSATEILEYFVRRWQMEVTFEEARRHLGFETQRQWSDAAIARTTPVILALFTLVTLMAARLARGGALPMRQATWYAKKRPTFSDALAAVRAHLWRSRYFTTSHRRTDRAKIPRALAHRLQEAVCYAA